MKKIRFISQVILVLSFSSCKFTDDCVKVPLPNHDLEWLDPYKAGDTMIFSCQTTHLNDSFVVIKSGNYFTDCNKFEFGNYQYNFAKVSLRPIKSGIVLYHENGIQLEFSNDSQPNGEDLSMKSFLVNDLSADFKNFKDLDLDSIAIGEKTYPVYHFDSENSICNDFNGKSFDVKSFYWNKKMGLLRYDKGTGEVFTLLKKK